MDFINSRYQEYFANVAKIVWQLDRYINMETVNIKLSLPEAKFLSRILGHLMSFLLNFDMKVERTEIDKLKVKIDKEIE